MQLCLLSLHNRKIWVDKQYLNFNWPYLNATAQKSKLMKIERCNLFHCFFPLLQKDLVHLFFIYMFDYSLVLYHLCL